MKKHIIIIVLILILTFTGNVSAIDSENEYVKILPGSDKNAVDINWHGHLNIDEDEEIGVEVYDKSYINTKNIDGEERATITFLVFHNNRLGWGESIKYLPREKFKGPGGFVEKTNLPLIKIGDKWIGKITIVPKESIKAIQIWKHENTGKKYFGVGVQIPESNKKLIEVGKNPEKGFHWNYYLYIPKNISSSQSSNYLKHMLVQPNNTGTFTDDIDIHDEAAKKTAESNPLAQELGIPILVPVFSRPRTIKNVQDKGYMYYTHSLDRQTLSLEIKKYKRLDRQLVAMIEHAQDLLAQRKIQLKDKVFMFGYSAAGTFTNRFITLHPEKVQAIAAGGICGLPTLPLEKINNKELYYPVGVYDIKELTGSEFNFAAYKKIPQYLFMGNEDTNDTLPYPAPYNEWEKEIIKEVFNTEPIPIKRQSDKEYAQILIKRFNKAKEFYEQEEIPAQFVLYEGIGHRLTPKIIEDVVRFFKNNADNKLDKILPFNN